MRFRIRHLTRYRYEAEVLLGPQTLRLTPRDDANQRLLSSQLDLTPPPAGRSELVDLDGNRTTAVWFDGRTSCLTIAAESLVETLRDNPFDYLWQGPETLPLGYDPKLTPALAPYRGDAASDEVSALAEAVAVDVAQRAQAFPLRLAQALHDRIRTIDRPRGGPLPPAMTLAQGEGSCRDLAVLFIAVCRQRGFACRFVSGYHAVESDRQELHAWAEVYLPGGGWRGFDPTCGLAVADRHIALAAGAEPWQAAPVSGTFRSRRSSTLETSVLVEPAVD